MEKRVGKEAALQMVDPLQVIETVMRYFFILGQTGREANAPLDEVRKCFEKAARLAALAAPYRHPRLSATKVMSSTDSLMGVKEGATVEELRAELAIPLRAWLHDGGSGFRRGDCQGLVLR
jgi:hypothetical protein